jgi:hypothetical protein
MCDQASGVSRLLEGEIVFGVACERCNTWRELGRQPYQPQVIRQGESVGTTEHERYLAFRLAAARSA